MRMAHMIRLVAQPDTVYSELIISQSLPENYAPLLVENIKKGGYTHVVAGHSAFGKNIMPRVSALLDSQQISDITGIESEDSESDAPSSLSRSIDTTLSIRTPNLRW